MIDRETMLRTIEATYQARQRGDKAGVAGVLAADATYRLIGRSHLLGGMPVGPSNAEQAIGGLIDQFHFPEVRLINVLIDGQRAAVHLAVRVVAAGTTDEVETELLDLWTFDGKGEVTDITEFADTALVSAMLSGLQRG